MVVLESVRKANSSLSRAIPRPVALFVGGTSGIGQSTLRQFVLKTDAPTAYIIGRSQSSAAPMLQELGNLNPRAKFNFIESDVTLIRNIDQACAQIKQQEKALNLIFMTTGYLSLTGRRETTEGIDKLFALRYYGRMRFIQNLLPLLEASPAARVISVLGGGLEGNIDPDNLDLKKGYNVVSCGMHSVTMNSLAMEHLASRHKISFTHVYPGIVGTNLYTNSFSAPVAAFYNYAMWPLMYPFSINLEESGQRHLFHATNARYPANGAAEFQGTAIPDGLDVATGSDGKPGSGAYLMNWNGETYAGGKAMRRLRENGMAEKVWEHTTNLLDHTAQSRDVENGSVGFGAKNA